MYTLKITVTQEILDGEHTCKRNVRHCAVAMAVRDIFPDARIGERYITPFKLPEEYFSMTFVLMLNNSPVDFMNFKMPNGMQEYIAQFDLGLKMNPASFELEIPDWVIEKINIDEIKLLLENHPSLQLINS